MAEEKAVTDRAGEPAREATSGFLEEDDRSDGADRVAGRAEEPARQKYDQSLTELPLDIQDSLWELAEELETPSAE